MGNKDKLLFIGEVGLDYAQTKDKEQQETFQKMISLAEKLKKSLVVHSRKAEQEAVAMLESSKAKKVIMHCFSGNFSLIKKIEDNGWHFSIPTNIVRSTHFQELVRKVDINQLLTETDSPFLSPYPRKRNEPSFVIEAVKKIAEIKGMDIIEVENNLFMNFQRLI